MWEIKITIEGTEKELADLALTVQSRQAVEFKKYAESIFLKAALELCNEENKTLET